MILAIQPVVVSSISGEQDQGKPAMFGSAPGPIILVLSLADPLHMNLEMTERRRGIAIMPAHIMFGGFENFQVELTKEICKGCEKFGVCKTEMEKPLTDKTKSEGQ